MSIFKFDRDTALKAPVKKQAFMLQYTNIPGTNTTEEHTYASNLVRKSGAKYQNGIC